jgi:hypothetical protein
MGWKSCRGANRRSSAIKVVKGKVQRKNRWQMTRTKPVIHREPPGENFRHVVKRHDVMVFLDLIPQWDELSVGLKTIVLAEGSTDLFGWYAPGKIALCAWEDRPNREWSIDFFNDHRTLLERLEVPFYKHGERFLVEFNERKAKAFMLLHILLHELGHHHDRMTTRHRNRCSRGESFAEIYAYDQESLIFDRYCDAIGI